MQRAVTNWTYVHKRIHFKDFQIQKYVTRGAGTEVWERAHHYLADSLYRRIAPPFSSKSPPLFEGFQHTFVTDSCYSDFKEIISGKTFWERISWF